jgi:hypothetical protein
MPNLKSSAGRRGLLMTPARCPGKVLTISSLSGAATVR